MTTITEKPKHRRYYLIAIALSLALSVSSILSGYLFDCRLFTSSIYRAGAFSLYGYIPEMRRLDLLPWWASENLKIDFFRPLSSATLAMDFALGDKAPTIPHLHQALWFIVLLLGAFQVLKQLLPRGRYLKVAVFVFALASYHSYTVGYVAARHALMGGTLAVWALYHYISWHRRGDGKSLILSLGLFLLGLLSSEAALAFAPVAVIYDFVFRAGNLKTRMKNSVWVRTSP